MQDIKRLAGTVQSGIRGRERGGAFRIIYIAAFFSIYFLWGVNYLAIRFAVETIPPLHIVGIRNFTAGLVLFFLARLRYREKLTVAHWLSSVKIGTLLFVFCHMGVVTASRVLPSGIVSLVVTTIPIWMVLIDWMMRYSKRPGWRVILGISLGTLGMIFLIGPGDLVGIAEGNILSVIFLIFATVSWAFGSIYSKKLKLPDSVMLSSSMQMMTGGAVSLLILAVSGRAGDLHFSEVNLRSFLAFLYMVIIGSIVSYTAYAWLLRNSPVSKVSTYTYVNAIIALSVGWLAGDGEFDTRILFSAVMIIAGVVIILSGNKNNKNGKRAG